MTNPRQLRIFLNYAPEDEPTVRALYERLQDDGFAPWMADLDLLPGQNRQHAIQRAVRSSDIVLICISSTYLGEPGYFHKEIKSAVDITDDLPEDTIFIIPVRIEACAVPENLKALQWVDLFEDNGYELLMRALQARAAQIDAISQLDIEQQQQHLEAYRQTLSHYLTQKAAPETSYVPADITQRIRDIRHDIRRTKDTLRRWGVDVIDKPDDELKHDLSQQWQDAVLGQQMHMEAGLVVPELQTFIADFCKKVDFVIQNGDSSQAGFALYRELFVLCHIKAPTMHLNIPTTFPFIGILETDVSVDIVKQIPHVFELPNIPYDFGLILTTDDQRHVQNLINELIRPALKTDLIVLGKDFLDEVASSHYPRSILLQEIVHEVDLNRISPFMAGGAVFDSMFFGRKGEIKTIAEALEKTSVAIMCGRRMGKTSLLNRLAHVELPHRGHGCFLLNCQPVHNYHELLTEMVVQWKHSALPSLPALPFDPEQPSSFAQVVEALTEATGKPPIFLLDEVDELLIYDSNNQQRLFKQLRALSLDGRARFVMTGERTVQAHIHDANSPLFNFFGQKLKLSFLDFAAVQKLVSEPLSDMQIGIQLPDRVLKTIFAATSGHPYLVQRLCQGLVQIISKDTKRAIHPAHIEMVLDNSDYQQDYFETVWGQAPSLACLITMLIDKPSVTLKDIQRRLNDYDLAPSLREINAALNMLDLYSVLTRKSGCYSFVATAFPNMLQRAYGEDLETNIALRCEEYLWDQTSSSVLVL